MLEHYQKHDIIFLDILIDGEERGIKTAERIRRKDEDALLVFYTAYDYPASGIIEVQPFHYLLKGDDTEKTKKGLRKILKEVDRREHTPLILAVYKGIEYVLRPEDVLYISILDKGTAIYPTTEKILKISGFPGSQKEWDGLVMKSSVKLDDYYRKLRAYGFAYAKKSYIINVHHIVAKMNDSVQLKDGTILSIARSRRKEFESYCSNYWKR